ncbi:uncharacterized protein LOC141689378 isoform X2 [Apium graveolens]|uniref:uncharacterized protein LOC141689378 isoform X2 n=1 Tax=Apium graveolens TaxID=4045 RepID=UPI003D7B5385
MSESGRIRSKRKLVFPTEESKKCKAASDLGTPALWTEEDEILLLKKMVDYETTHQCNPYDDLGKFHKFVKPFLHFDFQRKQLTNKLWKLKTRFLNSDYNSNVSHHAKLLEISKSIRSWGQHANASLDVTNSDDQNVEEDNVVVDDVGLDKLSKGVQTDQQGKLVTAHSRNGKKGKVVNTGDMVVEDVDAGKGKLVVKDKKKGSVEADYVVVNVDKSSKVDKSGKKGKFVISDAQNNEKVDGVVGDVDAAGDAQNVDAEKAVADNVQNPKKYAKKSAQVLGDKNVPEEVSSRENLKDFTFLFPELTSSMLELETLSWMPQHIKKKRVMDTINFMGWEKANELEKEWVNVLLMEMELKAKKFDMTCKQRNLIFKAMCRELKP